MDKGAPGTTFQIWRANFSGKAMRSKFNSICEMKRNFKLPDAIVAATAFEYAATLVTTDKGLLKLADNSRRDFSTPQGE